MISFFVFRWPDTVLTLCSVFERTASKRWLSSAWRDLCKLLLLTSQMPIHRKVDPGICKGWRGTAGWWLNGQAFMSRRWVSHTGCFVLWTCISFRPAVLFYTKLGQGGMKTRSENCEVDYRQANWHDTFLLIQIILCKHTPFFLILVYGQLCSLKLTLSLIFNEGPPTLHCKICPQHFLVLHEINMPVVWLFNGIQNVSVGVFSETFSWDIAGLNSKSL